MKQETRSKKLETSTKHEAVQTSRFDLEIRTLKFARAVRSLIVKLPNDIATREDAKQLIRSSGSISANYIEANEVLTNYKIVSVFELLISGFRISKGGL